MYVAELRRQISQCGQKYAQSRGVPHRLSYGAMPAVVFEPDEDARLHGNFLEASYRAILKNSQWHRRLTKVHSQRKVLPEAAHGCWRELDSCHSSDALLMNVFCHPKTLCTAAVQNLLGVEAGAVAEFGYRARVPLAIGKFDRTEVDMRIGNLLVESKLTEADFQRKSKVFAEAYRDFHEVFDCRRLPQTSTEYLSYQLLRNVLAAHAIQGSFCVLADQRRPDMLEAWFAVMQAVKPIELRTRCKVLTWQELTTVLPKRLQSFLREKYLIVAAGNSPHANAYRVTWPSKDYD